MAVNANKYWKGAIDKYTGYQSSDLNKNPTVFDIKDWIIAPDASVVYVKCKKVVWNSAAAFILYLKSFWFASNLAMNDDK